jgi:hypothetical protein
MYGIPLNVSLTFVERIEKAHGNQASGSAPRIFEGVVYAAMPTPESSVFGNCQKGPSARAPASTEDFTTVAVEKLDTVRRFFGSGRRGSGRCLSGTGGVGQGGRAAIGALPILNEVQKQQRQIESQQQVIQSQQEQLKAQEERLRRLETLLNKGN